MIRKTGIFLGLLIFSFPLISQSDGLLQTAGILNYELQLGESATVSKWTLISEDDFTVILELRAEGPGSELVSIPETVELGPGEEKIIDVTVTIPEDYQDNVEFTPSLFALQRGEEAGSTIINIQMEKLLSIKIGDNPVLFVEEVAEESMPEKEITLEAGEEEEVEVDLAPGGLQIQAPEESEETMEAEESEGGGCLIATAAYGSEMSQQVQLLREIRDAQLLTTTSGSTFMTGFNSLYYSFSPAIADLERQSPIFKETVKLAITPLLTSLTILNYVDMDSEANVLGYGIGLILLNVGMYFVAPAILITRLRK